MTISGELDKALETTPRLPRDAAAVALAQRYAGALDDCFDQLVNGDPAEDGAAHARVVLEIARLGQRLEAMLDRLGMAPGARPVIPGNPNGGERDPASTALDALRRDSTAGVPASGVDYAAAVDPAVAASLAED